MEERFDHAHPFYHFDIRNEPGTHPRGKHPNPIILLQKPIYKDSLAHGLLPARRRGGRNIACAICKSVGKKAPVLTGNDHLDFN